MASVALRPACSLQLRHPRQSVQLVHTVLTFVAQSALRNSQRAMVTAAAAGGSKAALPTAASQQQQGPVQQSQQKQQQAQPEAKKQQQQQQQAKQQQARTRPTQGQLVERCMVRGGPPTIDIGANLIDRSFDKDRDAVLARAQQAGVQACIVTGTCVRTAQAAAELCASPLGQAHGLRFTAGCHPHNAKVHPVVFSSQGASAAAAWAVQSASQSPVACIIAACEMPSPQLLSRPAFPCTFPKRVQELR